MQIIPLRAFYSQGDFSSTQSTLFTGDGFCMVFPNVKCDSKNINKPDLTSFIRGRFRNRCLLVLHRFWVHFWDLFIVITMPYRIAASSEIESLPVYEYIHKTKIWCSIIWIYPNGIPRHVNFLFLFKLVSVEYKVHKCKYKIKNSTYPVYLFIIYLFIIQIRS